MHTDYLRSSAPPPATSAVERQRLRGHLAVRRRDRAGRPRAYKYIAARIGDTAEAQWADGAYTSLLNANNAGWQPTRRLTTSTSCRARSTCRSPATGAARANDANWACTTCGARTRGTILLQGGTLNGILGDPTQTDNMYQTGFARLAGTGVPFPSFGAYTGYSVALNTAYSAGALYGNAYRDLPITSYAWQIATTTGGRTPGGRPTARAPDPTNPWQGSHAAPSSARSRTSGRWPARPRHCCSRWSPRE